MNDLILVGLTGATILGLVIVQALRRKLDPFAPIWLFLIGYSQVYVLQPITYRQWAIDVRGEELVTAAAFRAFWALLVFLGVYHSGIGPAIARRFWNPPETWSTPVVAAMSPVLVVWGLICSGFLLRYGSLGGAEGNQISAEEHLFRAFPLMMLLGGVLMVVTGRHGPTPRPAWTFAGVAVIVAYIFIWIFNGKRSVSLFGVLSLVCVFYVSKLKRPGVPVLAATGVAGIMAVSLSIGWRGTEGRYEQSASGFLQFLSEWNPESILVNLNLKGRVDEASESIKRVSYETEEWGGYLLMLSTVPEKSEYDYGESYLRLYSTYVPRIFWKDKPYYGRSQWIHAWMAGSEFPREESFTGPAIGLLGAAQLNGGAVATAILLAVLAILQRAAYEYFRMYSTSSWVQAWWSLTYYNAWLMTVNDDPFVWFYYVYGHTAIPPFAFLFIVNKLGASRAGSAATPGLVGHAGLACELPGMGRSRGI